MRSSLACLTTKAVLLHEELLVMVIVKCHRKLNIYDIQVNFLSFFLHFPEYVCSISSTGQRCVLFPWSHNIGLLTIMLIYLYTMVLRIYQTRALMLWKNVGINFSIFCVPNCLTCSQPYQVNTPLCYLISRTIIYIPFLCIFYCFLATILPPSNAEKLHMLVLCQLRCIFGYVDDQEAMLRNIYWAMSICTREKQIIHTAVALTCSWTWCVPADCPSPCLAPDNYFVISFQLYLLIVMILYMTANLKQCVFAESLH